MDHAGDTLGAERSARQWRRLASSLSFRRDLAVPIVVLVVQLGATAALSVSHHGLKGQLSAVDWLLLVVGPLALVVRRSHPVAVMWVAFAATFSPSGARLAYLSLIVAFFVAATGGHRRAAWSAIVLGYVSSIWLIPLAYGKRPDSLAALALGGWLAVLVVAAEATRIAREKSAQSAAARQLDARRRASEERLAMAGDLHDVIGHNISLINIQAGVGLDLVDTQPDQARAALQAIRTVSKEALDELRAMLGALRQPGEEAPRAPTPGLAQLDDLVERTRAAGVPVTTEIVGEQRSLPAAVDLAAYRIVQESLTNVARHAASAKARVRLTYRTDGVQIDVTDDGRRTPSNGSVPPGTGSGIAGMRQRAEVLGGHLDAGPGRGGGFTVTACLPVGENR
jgi:signal transduction histidine kinase